MATKKMSATASTIYLSANATEADLQKAIDSLGDGGKVVLAANSTISISSGIVVDVSQRSVTIDLNGSTLKQTGDCTVVTIKGGHDALTTATVGQDSSGSTTVTYANAASQVKVGDWVKITADDTLDSDQGTATHLGQAMQVTAVSGNVVTLAGTLIDADQYQTDVRASGINSGTALFTNGTVQGDQSHPTWVQDLIEVRSTVGTTLSGITVRDGNSMGINFVGTVNGTVLQCAAINLTDDTANSHYGYGVHSASSWNTTVNGFYAENVRHAIDDNSVGFDVPASDPAKYGADFQLNATNVVAYETTSFAFSWHSEGRYGVDHDSVVIDSYGVLGARGVGNAAYNISGVGDTYGVMFYEYGAGDGRGIIVSNFDLDALTGYAAYSRGTAVGNVLVGSSFQTIATRLLTNSQTYMASDTVTVAATAASVSLTGTNNIDRLLGGDGADKISGGAGNDYIFGGLGADTLKGGLGSDRFAYIDIAEAGDTISDFTAGSGGDVIDLSSMAYHYGWHGNLFTNGYVRYVTSGSDTLVQVDIDGGGNSFVTLTTLHGVAQSLLTADNISTNIVVSDYGTAVTSAAALSVVGTAANDTLVGGSGADRLSGGDGNDVLIGGAGADVLMGGAGSNLASYETATSGVLANLLTPGMNTGDAAGDTYSQIQGFIGSAFSDQLFANHGATALYGGNGADFLGGLDGADSLYGGSGNDMLYGGAAADVLSGGSGIDILDGGTGYNTLTGGAGADSFQFSVNDGQKDTITDFTHGLDIIAISRDAFGLASTATLTFAADKAHVTTAAPTFWFDAAAHTLYFDADGKGAGASVAVALLTGISTLYATDIVLF
jgi:Ca2+-binding RTX toxin-like protein